MNRIQQLFTTKNKRVLSVYYTAGFPNLSDTLAIAIKLEEAGVDMLEIGIPYSDPIADGTTIQQSSACALSNGMSIRLLFEQLADLRKYVRIPVLLMGYLNPVMQYGIENFCMKAKEVGVDGVILPDLPLFEYEHIYKSCFEHYGLSNVFLINPRTEEERIRKIDELSNGFIYMLSSNATTGNSLEQTADLITYYERVKGYRLLNPLMIGFGINTHHQFNRACEYANGAIIGSAFIRFLNSYPTDYGDKILGWVESIVTEQ